MMAIVVVAVPWSVEVVRIIFLGSKQPQTEALSLETYRWKDK